MSAPIIKIKRGATAPVATLNAGEFAIDQVAKNLYLGVEVGGVVTNEVVGGEGTFATKSYVATAVTNATGSLGTMSTQNANSVAITGGTIDGAGISNAILSGQIECSAATITGALISASNFDAANGSIYNVGTPMSSGDAANKGYVDSAIGALGAVFHYAGNVSDATTPFDLSTLPYQTTGSYYRVDVAGTYVDPVHPNASFEAKVGDAFVLSVASGFQKIDNVDVEVLDTPNEITVTGDENVGYTVSIDPVFSGRVSNTESLTQNFGSVSAGSTEINGNIWGNGSLTLDGYIDIGGNADILGNISASGTVSGTNITDLETKTQNITAIAGETYVAGILTSQELWVGPSSTDAVKLLNAGSGTQAILEMPAGKQFVIKTDTGAEAIKVGSGNGLVDFAYDVNITQVLNAGHLSVANSANVNTLSVTSTANFNGGINLNTGNLVGNGTNEITDFVIDGGSY